MDYKLFTNKNGARHQIKNVGNIEWSDDLDFFTTEMSFKSTEVIDIGTQVALLNDANEILRGVVIGREWDKNKIYSYTVFDNGFYLGHNEVIIQFNGCTISQALQQLLNKVKHPIGGIVEIPACVKKIYKDVVVSDIIKELLEMAKKKTGKDYILRVICGEYYVEEFIKIEVSPTFDMSGDSIKITDYIGNFSAKDSMEDMKNRVLIIDNKEKSTFVVAQASDDESISRYGELCVVETQDEDDKTPKQTIANNMLVKLNKFKQERSVDLLGSDEIKKGVLLSFSRPELGFMGQYLITSSHHTIDGGLHKVSVDLEAYDESIV